ncbi:hypothetical protein IGI04_028483 [Brassica rapa subsp. trilocularis]|uniref:Protein kinase domain-containing protein n=1 Tax=Brassica rapa subsp. trilocularis TaxID=1813537 RepID=A0ABQ7L230_BRACM|nr:hypothetical protein IGI04_028483 [Brassica rapa subsp. trilocularis]
MICLSLVLLPLITVVEGGWSSILNPPAKFPKVVRGTWDWTSLRHSGIKFKLIISAKDEVDGMSKTYEAIVMSGACASSFVGRFQGDQQFHAEILSLETVRHPNLVMLIGYHASEKEMFLIYNYLSGGNLEDFIKERSKPALEWKILHKIALNVARALAYLHEQCSPKVLHRDIKPSNILLDNNYNAYLSDFGLSTLLRTSRSHVTTGVA